MFARTYKDNEESDEEEKKGKTKAARSRESLPFGLNIRKAAYKAAFGQANNNVLQRYATMGGGATHRRVSMDDELGESLEEDDESDSVSSYSGSEDSLSLESLDVDPTQITAGQQRHL